VQQDGFGKLKKNAFTSSRLEPATFWFVAQCLNHYANDCGLLTSGLEGSGRSQRGWQAGTPHRPLVPALNPWTNLDLGTIIPGAP
jgi:hypothetical protein